MVSRQQATARLAALEARTAPIRKVPPMPTVVEIDDHRRRRILEETERRTAALEARILPIIERTGD